jgi:DnaD/phage-associated family protein
MERIRLTPPGENRERGSKARLYVRWMPHIGAEAVALYELLRVLPEIGRDDADPGELAELLCSTPESVEESLKSLVDHGFIAEHDGWMEVARQPPVARRENREGRHRRDETAAEYRPPYEIEVVRAEPEGVSSDDYFKYMGSLPAPHILEFLNGYRERDGLEADVVREALKISSERDARRVGYVRSILENWVQRGVKTMQDVELFEKDRRLRLVGESGTMRTGEGVKDGADRQSAARRREDYKWFFGE